MSNDMWRYLIAGFLIVHGIGHSSGHVHDQFAADYDRQVRE